MEWERWGSSPFGCALAVLAFAVCANPALAVDAAPTALPAVPELEREPNGSALEAGPIATGKRVRGRLSSSGDVDYYRFGARAGDLVFAGTVTRFLDATGNATRLTLLEAGSGAPIETDDSDGSFVASNISGAAIAADGEYLLEVSHPSPGGGAFGYDLYLQLRSGPPGQEIESNNTPATANPLAEGFVAGTQNPAGRDAFAMPLAAGDTVFLSLDLDPERDGDGFNGRLGFGLLGEPGYILAVSNQPPFGTPSASYEITVLKEGMYYAHVNAIDAAEGGPQATYRLSATVLPAARPSCRTFAVSPSPGLIPDVGTAVFPISVPDLGTVTRAAVRLDLTHGHMGDLTIALRAPGGYEAPLFRGNGRNAIDSHMVAAFDLFAANSGTSALQPVVLQPLVEPAGWVDGRSAAGTWGLVVRDESAGEAGTVSRVELVLCTSGPPEPEPPPAAVGSLAPSLSSLFLSPPLFRAVTRKASNARATPGAPLGTTISYVDSQAATARLTVLRRLRGQRMADGRCASRAGSSKGARRCVRWQPVGSFVHRDRAGENLLRFAGRVNGRALAPGRYAVAVVATSGAGQVSNELKKQFRIAP